MGSLGFRGSDCIHGSPPCALLDGKAVVVSVCFPGLEIVSKGVLWTHLHVHFLSSALCVQKVQTYLPTDLESLSTSLCRVRIDSSLSGVERGRAFNPDVVFDHLTGL